MGLFRVQNRSHFSPRTITYGVQAALSKDNCGVQNQRMRAALLHRISQLRRERGNDLLELALAIAFVALGSTPLSTGADTNVQGMLQSQIPEVVHVHNR